MRDYFRDKAKAGAFLFMGQYPKWIGKRKVM